MAAIRGEEALLIFLCQDLAFMLHQFLIHLTRNSFFNPPTIPFSIWYSWLGFRHPFATVWLSRCSGLARLSLHLQIKIWMSLDHVIWPRLLANLISVIAPRFGPISFAILRSKLRSQGKP